MLRKLIKHEFKANWKTFGLIYAALLILTLVTMLWSSIFVTLLTVKIMFFTSVRIVLQKVFYNYYTNAVSHDCM